MNSLSLLFIVSLIASISVLIFKPKLSHFIQALLSFSGAYLLGICFIHLLPELFEYEMHSIGIFILIGFFLQLSLDYFSGGIEHGHIHVHHSKVGKSFPWLVLFSLCLHAFLESTPLLHLSEGKGELDSPFLWGLFLHKIPIAIVLSALLVSYQIKSFKIILAISFFALMAPLGAMIGFQLESNAEYLSAMIALSVGIILHLSTTILVESNEEHKGSWKKIIPMLLGAVLSLLSAFFH